MEFLLDFVIWVDIVVATNQMIGKNKIFKSICLLINKSLVGEGAHMKVLQFVISFFGQNSVK